MLAPRDRCVLTDVSSIDTVVIAATENSCSARGLDQNRYTKGTGAPKEINIKKFLFLLLLCEEKESSNLISL